MSALREGTRAEHDAIEAALDMTGMTLEAYRGLLERFRGFYAPLERALGAVGDWSTVGIDFKARVKTPRLVRDLEVLGFVGDVSAGAEWEVEALRGWPEAFGAFYVLEGASLGGQVITRRLQRDFGVTPETGGSFFAGYGDDTRAMWVGFCEALSGFSPAPDQRIVDAAIATFQAMRHWCGGWTSSSTGS